jgi:hypothetical protein
MEWATFLVGTAHLLLAAVWLGAMAYSIAVVQPKLLQYFASPQAAEEPATFVAAGARWKVIGVIAALAVTGAALVALHDARSSVWWWVLVGAKLLLLVVASIVFWYVSWRMWPRRVFSLPAEIPARQAAFRRVGWLLLTVVGAATVLGVAARTLA